MKPSTLFGRYVVQCTGVQIAVFIFLNKVARALAGSMSSKKLILHHHNYLSVILDTHVCLFMLLRKSIPECLFLGIWPVL